MNAAIKIDSYKYINIIKLMDTAKLLKSLADETRLGIVRKLAIDNCEVASEQIVDSCAQFHKLSQPTMSHHFAKLVASGVINERKDGVGKFYRLNSELLTTIGINIVKLLKI
jgi:DNA-binding transcriptional ArsR family regulator